MNIIWLLRNQVIWILAVSNQVISELRNDMVHFIVKTFCDMWAHQNLSLGFWTKLDSNQSPLIQRLDR